jgi:hypothetical protein
VAEGPRDDPEEFWALSDCGFDDACLSFGGGFGIVLASEDFSMVVKGGLSNDFKDFRTSVVGVL